MWKVSYIFFKSDDPDLLSSGLYYNIIASDLDEALETTRKLLMLNWKEKEYTTSVVSIQIQHRVHLSRNDLTQKDLFVVP